MAHTYDTKAVFAYANTPTTDQITYTCGVGATLLVLDIVVDGTTGRAGGSPTYNGVAFTASAAGEQLASETITECWYYLNPPCNVALKISIPNTGTAKYITAVASSYKAGAQMVSVLHQGYGRIATQDNPAGTAHTSLVAGMIIIAAVGTSPNAFAPSAQTGTTLDTTYDQGSYGAGFQYFITTGTGDVTMSWTFAANPDPNSGVCSCVFKEQRRRMAVTHV